MGDTTFSSETQGKTRTPRETGKMGVTAELENQSPGDNCGAQRGLTSHRRAGWFSDAFPATNRTLAHKLTEALKSKV